MVSTINLRFKKKYTEGDIQKLNRLCHTKGYKTRVDYNTGDGYVQTHKVCTDLTAALTAQLDLQDKISPKGCIYITLVPDDPAAEEMLGYYTDHKTCAIPFETLAIAREMLEKHNPRTARMIDPLTGKALR